MISETNKFPSCLLVFDTCFQGIRTESKNSIIFLDFDAVVLACIHALNENKRQQHQHRQAHRQHIYAGKTAYAHHLFSVFSPRGYNIERLKHCKHTPWVSFCNVVSQPEVSGYSNRITMNCELVSATRL